MDQFRSLVCCGQKHYERVGVFDRENSFPLRSLVVLLHQRAKHVLLLLLTIGVNGITPYPSVLLKDYRISRNRSNS
eukprot:scaffold2593_cov170-Amphora_coffeaeformis.AAC.1